MKYIKSLFIDGVFKMDRWRVVFAGLLVMLVTVGVSTAFASSDTHSSKEPDQPYLVREYDLSEGGQITINSISGDIEVHQGEGRKVRIELYVKRGFALWSSGKSLDNYRITTFKRDQSITASIERISQGTSFWGSAEVKFNFKVIVPSQVSMDVKTAAGKISLNGVSGQQQLKNTGGDIEVQDSEGHALIQSAGGNVTVNQYRGEVEADAKGGTIQISDAQGHVNVRAIGGPVNLNRLEGEVRVKTTAGNIEARNISGTFLAQSNVGNVNVWMDRVDQGVSLDSDVGSVFLQLPEDGNYQFSVSGSSLTTSMPERFEGQQTDRSLKGKIGDGTHPIQVDVASGHVELQLGREGPGR